MSTPNAVGQNGDVYLFQTIDDGEMDIENGIVTMSAGLDTAVYLSLFGGNYEDDGSYQNQYEWWGNRSETIPSHKYRSETQALLRSIPISSGNIIRMEAVAVRDLNWILEERIADKIDVTVTIPGIDQVTFDIRITAQGVETKFSFTENWRASL
jgi:phage gp46-like protein